MRPIADAPARLYCQLMVAIKARLRGLDQVTVWDRQGEFGPEELYQIEAAMLSLRKVLELIAYSSLVANEVAMAAAVKDIGEMWRARKILERIEQVNRDFFPIPVEVSHMEGGELVVVPKPGQTALERSEFPFLYDVCGEFIHVQNPFSTDGFPDLRRSPKEWIQRIRALLEVHQVTLIGDEIGVVQMNGWGEVAPVFAHAGRGDGAPTWGTGSRARPVLPARCAG